MAIERGVREDALRREIEGHLGKGLAVEGDRDLLVDAQNRWKMVRIGFRREPSATSVQAEVDLSGAPHSVLSGLFTVALSALHAVAAWVVPTAEFLVDHTAELWALSDPIEVNAEQSMKMKGGETHE